MAFAPHDACARCFAGDVGTGFAALGEAEWIMFVLGKQMGVPQDQAMEMVKLIAREHYGCDPGKVPGGNMTVVVRLCTRCAEATGTKVGELGGRTLPTYAQPPDL